MGATEWIAVGMVVGYVLRWAVTDRAAARCSRVRYGSQCVRREGHPGPHKAWIDWAMSPTRIGHTEHWHDETRLN